MVSMVDFRLTGRKVKILRGRHLKRIYGQGSNILKESTLMRHCPSFNKLVQIIRKNSRGSRTKFKVDLNEPSLGLSWEDSSPK